MASHVTCSMLIKRASEQPVSDSILLLNFKYLFFNYLFCLLLCVCVWGGGVPVMSLVGWSLCLTVKTIRLTHPCSALPALPFTQTPDVLCCGSDTTSGGRSEPEQNCTPISASVTFTQTAKQSIDNHIERAVWMGLLLNSNAPGPGASQFLMGMGNADTQIGLIYLTPKTQPWLTTNFHWIRIRCITYPPRQRSWQVLLKC